MEPSESRPRLRLRYPPPPRRVPPPRAVPPAGAGAFAAPGDSAAPRPYGARPEPRSPGGKKPALDASDPRWVLAVRTSGLLRGAVLRPRDRDSLLRLSRAMGLRPFEANLVIAVVQDRARRGLPMDAAAELLRFVPRPTPPTSGRETKHRSRIALWTAAILLIELLLVLSIL